MARNLLVVFPGFLVSPTVMTGFPWTWGGEDGQNMEHEGRWIGIWWEDDWSGMGKRNSRTWSPLLSEKIPVGLRWSAADTVKKKDGDGKSIMTPLFPEVGRTTWATSSHCNGRTTGTRVTTTPSGHARLNHEGLPNRFDSLWQVLNEKVFNLTLHTELQCLFP